jgi:isopentenyl-diphosphate Delta-isomerase
MSLSEEMLPEIDAKGKLSGRAYPRAFVHSEGILHPVVRIWLYRADGTILLQKRSLTKKTCPGLWDCSVAGHVAAGQSYALAATREIAEETGYSLEADKLHKVHEALEEWRSQDALIVDREFQYTYVAALAPAAGEPRLEPGEADAFRFVTRAELSERAQAERDATARGEPSSFVYHPGEIQAVIDFLWNVLPNR